MTIRKLQENIKNKDCFFVEDGGCPLYAVAVPEDDKGMGRTFIFGYDYFSNDISVEIRAGVIDDIPYGEKAGFVVDKDTFLSLSEEMFDNFIEVAVANISIRRNMKSAS